MTIPKAKQPEEIPTWHSTPKEYMMETLVTCSQFSAGSKTFFFFNSSFTWDRFMSSYRKDSLTTETELSQFQGYVV